MLIHPSIPPRSTGGGLLRRQRASGPPTDQLADLTPGLDGNGRVARPVDNRIDPRVRSGDSITRESGLVVPLTQEVGEDERAQERVAERNGAEQDANEDEQLSERNDPHRSVVVSFDPDLQTLGQRVGLRRTTLGSRRGRRKELRHQSRTSEREGVEERENGVRNESDSNRLRSPPEEGEQKVLDILVQ